MTLRLGRGLELPDEAVTQTFGILSLGFIDYPIRGWVKATPILFLEEG